MALQKLSGKSADPDGRVWSTARKHSCSLNQHPRTKSLRGIEAIALTRFPKVMHGRENPNTSVSTLEEAKGG